MESVGASVGLREYSNTVCCALSAVRLSTPNPLPLSALLSPTPSSPPSLSYLSLDAETQPVGATRACSTKLPTQELLQEKKKGADPGTPHL